MEENLSNRETVQQDSGLCVCKGGPSLNILKEVQKAYEERIELINKVGGKDKLQKELDLLRAWVGDLVEQNGLLARAVEEMETEISARVMLERRRNSEAVCELRAEVGALRRRLARKDSDVRGLLELLRRLREYDHRDIHDIRFYEVTERDIFGCTGQTDMENEEKQSDKRSDKQGQNRKEKKEFPHREQKKSVCGKLHELQAANETLQKENCTKDREIRKLSNDVQQYEQMVASLKKEVSKSRNFSTKDEEIMTEATTPVQECACACACGDSVPVQDCGGSSAWKQLDEYHNTHDTTDLKMKPSSESVRAIRKQNVELKEEIRATGQLCAALYEQQHAAALRLQFKDDIIREMRRQLRQAKAKLEMTKSVMPMQKALSAEREDGSGAEAAHVMRVRTQPRRRSRIDIEWECRSRSRDASSDDTTALKPDPP